MAGESFILMGVSGSGKTLIGSKGCRVIIC